MTGQTLHLRITLVAPPAGVLYALQDGEAAVGQVMSDGGDLSLDVSVRFVEDDKGVRYLGPFVKNQGGRRFVYFRVGTSAGQHGSPWTRRGKVWFEDLAVALARAAAAAAGGWRRASPEPAGTAGPAARRSGRSADGGCSPLEQIVIRRRAGSSSPARPI